MASKKVKLTARCTEDEKERIKRNAKKMRKSESDYIRDCCMAPIERRNDRDKKVLIQSVKIKEAVNNLRYSLDKNKSVLPEDFFVDINKQLTKMMEEMLCLF